MEYLTVKEYAELRGCNEQYVRKLISQSKLSVEESWGKGGNKGLHYRIPLASIEPKLQAKYRRIHSRKENAGKPKEQKPVLLPDVEHLTAKEREEIVFWKDILLEWEDYRPPGRSRKEATADFVSYLQEKYPEMVFSERILYRKAQALRESGDAALVDRRGKHGKHKKAIPEKVFEIFEYFYLDQTCKSVSLCRTLTELEIKQHPDKYDQSLLPLASFATFNREVDRSIPLPTQMEAYVASDAMNAVYEEFGTGEYALEGNGRKGGWWYMDEKGKYHFTKGKKPHRPLYRAYTMLKEKIIARAKAIFQERMT